MKIILLNLFDAFLPAYLLSYFSDHTWEKAFKASLLLRSCHIYCRLYFYNALTLHLTGNTSILQPLYVYAFIILHYYLAFIFF